MRTSPAIFFFLFLVFPHPSPGQASPFCPTGACDLPVGPISLHVQAVPRVYVITSAPNSLFDVSKLTISVDGAEIISQALFAKMPKLLSASALAATINSLDKGVVAELFRGNT